MLKSTSERYGSVAILLHWLTAFAFLAALVAGLVLDEAHTANAKLAILRLHIPAAMVAIALTLVRLVWWFGFDTKPLPLTGTPQWQNRLAAAVHALLYVAILLLAVSGMAMLVSSELFDLLMNGTIELKLPRFERIYRNPHGLAANIAMVLVTVHVLAALYHHFHSKDGGLRRILRLP